jgi:DNA mismatch repair protein MutS
MKFEIDKQTLDDLAIFNSGNSNSSIFNLFNKTVTYGGKDKLREFFDNPLTNGMAIEERLNAICHLRDNGIGFTADKGSLDFIEHYLQQYNKPVSVSAIRAVEKWIIYKYKGNSEYYVLERGIGYLLELLQQFAGFIKDNDPVQLPLLLQQFHTAIAEILGNKDFKVILQLGNKARLGPMDIARADHLFRYSGNAAIKVLIDIVYQLDVFTTVASVGKKLGFSFPVVRQADEQKLVLTGIFHPLIDQPVLNDVEFNYNKNICFVTGANMAGKSTFLKSVGVCAFLSQIGFPVPATYMETSVFTGLITTINLGDNISNGNSHFYSEVLRVKHVAEKMNQSQQILVIFDELFRGTNVKDAYDASLAIISAFSKARKSFFIISTHIVEVANELAAIENIDFRFMETTFDDGIPKYSYKLRNGITEERMGMWIVNNEGIVDIINGFLKRK